MAPGSSDSPSRKRSGSRATQKGTGSRSSSTRSSSRRPTAEQPTAEQPSREGIRAEPPAGPVAGRRVLRRSRDDRVIAGVAGGVARYLGVDALIVRIAFVILAFPLPGILLYLLGWLFIPEEREGEPVGPPPRRSADRGIDIWMVIGVGLVGLGVILLIDRFVPWFDRITGPLILIALGAAVLIQGTRR